MFVFFILILMNWAMQVIYAQPSIKGSIINTKVIIPDVPRLELEDQDNDRLIRERDYPNDGVNNEPKIQFKRGPHRFGIHIPTKIDFFDIASAYISPDRTLITWRLTIYCRTAISLSCYFDNFFLGPGSELYIYGKEYYLGAFVPELNNNDAPRNVLVTHPILGNSIQISYSEKNPNQDPNSQKFFKTLVPISGARLHLCSVIYGYDDPFPNIYASYNKDPISYQRKGMYPVIKGSQHCHRSVPCEIDIKVVKNNAKSVVLLTIADGTETCTGTLLNNAFKDGDAYIATAYHCLFGEESLIDPIQKKTNHSLTLVTFEFEDSRCNSEFINRRNFLDAPIDLSHRTFGRSLQGTRYLGGFNKADIALLKLVDPIPRNWNVYFAGWSTLDAIQFNSPFYLIHHPVSDVKKMSITNGNIQRASWYEFPDTFHYHIQEWSIGATEPGSSGAPLFDKDGFVVGFLRGGLASCEEPQHDFCSTFQACYRFLLQQYLDPNKEYSDGSLEGISYQEILDKKKDIKEYNEKTSKFEL